MINKLQINRCLLFKHPPKYYLVLIFFLTFLLVQGQIKKEQDKLASKTRILFLFDGSQSMYARWQSDIKINTARKLFFNILDSLRYVEDLELALRVYGHQHLYPPQVCTDTKLEVPFGKKNVDAIKHRLRAITPRGTTLIAYALEKSAGDFPPCDNCRNIVILITDGIEECGGDPCEVSSRLQKEGIILKPFIIGIGRNFESAFDCAGTYFDASSEEQFQKALTVVISQALKGTSAQVNLLDESGNPSETNIAMTFYDNYSGVQLHNFIHTMNNRGLPDTLVMDPIPAYDLVVHTIPPVELNDIKLRKGEHNIIAVDASQGILKLKVNGFRSMVKDLQCIVRKNDEMQTLNVQSFDTEVKYRTGYYDLEVLCLPRIYIDNVELGQSRTTTVEIPMPGIVVINKTTQGYGSLYQLKDNKLEWIYNLRDGSANQESLILQPGRYKVIFRPKNSSRSIYTVERVFTVESGRTTNLKLYSN